MTDRPAKLLFVVSSDFGELTIAMHFVRGTAFDAVCLLPERLVSLNADALHPMRAGPFGSPEDVLAAVDRERADVVFLFSGYLYVVNGIFDLAGLERLVAGLRARGVAVATTDPFLGLLETLDDRTFSDGHPRKTFLMEHFGYLATLLRDLPHVYLVPADGMPPGVRLSFFNPAMVAGPEEMAAARRRLGTALPLADRPRWLFVLSYEDYGGQLLGTGRSAFDAGLGARLEDAVRAGRQPVLIAPEACVGAALLRGIDALVARPFVPFDVFTALLLDAEYAFYWNVLSNSFPVRGIHRLPVFFFDRGHLAHAIPPLYRLAIDRYFAGWDPPCLELGAPLDPAGLAALARAQRRALAPAEERFRSSPPPEAVVARLLSGRAAGTTPS